MDPLSPKPRRRSCMTSLRRSQSLSKDCVSGGRDRRRSIAADVNNLNGEARRCCNEYFPGSSSTTTTDHIPLPESIKLYNAMTAEYRKAQQLLMTSSTCSMEQPKNIWDYAEDASHSTMIPDANFIAKKLAAMDSSLSVLDRRQLLQPIRQTSADNKLYRMSRKQDILTSRSTTAPRYSFPNNSNSTPNTPVKRMSLNNSEEGGIRSHGGSASFEKPWHLQGLSVACSSSSETSGHTSFEYLSNANNNMANNRNGHLKITSSQKNLKSSLLSPALTEATVVCSTQPPRSPNLNQVKMRQQNGTHRDGGRLRSSGSIPNIHHRSRSSIPVNQQLQQLQFRINHKTDGEVEALNGTNDINPIDNALTSSISNGTEEPLNEKDFSLKPRQPSPRMTRRLSKIPTPMRQVSETEQPYHLEDKTRRRRRTISATSCHTTKFLK